MQFFPTLDKDKLRRRLLVAAVIFALVMAATRLIFLQSEPYEFARHFAATDQRLQDSMGKVETISLPFFQPFRFSFGETSGSANMILRAQTTANEFDIELNLKKKDGQWAVTRAEVLPKGSASHILVSEP